MPQQHEYGDRHVQRIEHDISPALRSAMADLGSEVHRHSERLERLIMSARDELLAKVNELATAQQENSATLTELVKDQDRVLAQLAELVASGDLSGVAELVARVQEGNAQQLATLQAADAALEAAVPEPTPEP
jgi:uncharacterized coiled-coil DUF342 family protein